MTDEVLMTPLHFKANCVIRTKAPQKHIYQCLYYSEFDVQ